MKVELDDECIDDIIAQSLRWHYENWVHDRMDEKESKKLLKAIKKVHNFYCKPSETIE